MIPHWNASGLVPPVAPGEHGASQVRSPYRSLMDEVVRGFVSSPERALIMAGLLQLRAQLTAAGLCGFQWLDGSFLERIEHTAARAPRDIDVVTFTTLGDTARQRELLEQEPGLFDGDRLADDLRVDHYYVNLDNAFDQRSVRKVAYWYSMWSHRRPDGQWKGFVEVPLDGRDELAMEALTTLRDTYASDGVP